MPLRFTDLEAVRVAHEQGVDCTFLQDCPTCGRLERLQKVLEETGVLLREEAVENSALRMRVLTAQGQAAEASAELQDVRRLLEQTLGYVELRSAPFFEKLRRRRSAR